MDARESLRRMRNLKKGVIENFETKPKEETKKREMSVRDMLGITRNFKAVNEDEEVKGIDLDQDGDIDTKVIDTDVESKITKFDENLAQEKFRNAIKEFNVNVQFEPIQIRDNSIVWSGTIDNQLQWSYLVTPDESINGPKFNYAENFNDGEPSNQQLVKFIEKYYDNFYKYWREGEMD